MNAGAYSLGHIYRCMGRVADAVACYRKSLELSPQRIGTHHVLAIALTELGRPRKQPPR